MTIVLKIGMKKVVSLEDIPTMTQRRGGTTEMASAPATPTMAIQTGERTKL